MAHGRTIRRLEALTEYAYAQVPLEGVLDVALSLREDGKRWRSHVLPPGCANEAYPDESPSLSRPARRGRYIAASSVFPAVDRALVKPPRRSTISSMTQAAAATCTDDGLWPRIRLKREHVAVVG